MKTYKGNIKIDSSNCQDWNKKLKDCEEITGYLSIYSQAKLDNLKSVGGYLSIYSRITEKLIKQLYFHNPKNHWYINDQQSEWIYSKTGKFTYQISDIEFPKGLFDKIRKGELSAQEVFAIENTEQRRIAYERMDKIKMKDLKTKVLSKGKEGKYPIRVVEITFDGFDDPFRYLNCFCPSTGREYYIETQQSDWKLAKAKSFGHDKPIKYKKEW